jgi:hypothetical protein
MTHLYKTTPIEVKIEPPTTKDSVPQETRTQQTEVTPIVQKHSSASHIEMWNENNIFIVQTCSRNSRRQSLNHWSLLMTPTTKSFAKEEQNEERKCSLLIKHMLRHFSNKKKNESAAQAK